MENQQDYLNEVYQMLESFYSFTVLGEDVINNRVPVGSGKWIINQDEQSAIIKVLDTLKDCGAKDPSELVEELKK